MVPNSSMKVNQRDNCMIMFYYRYDDGKAEDSPRPGSANGNRGTRKRKTN